MTDSVIKWKNARWISISFSSYLNWGGMTSTSESNLSIWGDDTSSFAWFLLLDPLVLETGLLLSSGIISNLSMLCAQSSFHDHLKPQTWVTFYSSSLVKLIYMQRGRKCFYICTIWMKYNTHFWKVVLTIKHV